MSVRVGDRPLSRIEFLYQANKICDSIQDLTFRNFGIYSKKSAFRKAYLNNIKYYDEHEVGLLLDESKKQLRLYSNSLCKNLKSANGLFPRSKHEYDIRLSNIDNALSCCIALLDELNAVARFFNTDILVFKNCVLDINREIDLIKRLKCSDRKRFGQLL